MHMYVATCLWASDIIKHIHSIYVPILGLLIILTVSLLVVFKVETSNTPTCSVFINSCSLTAAPLASSSKDYICNSQEILMIR